MEYPLQGLLGSARAPSTPARHPLAQGSRLLGHSLQPQAEQSQALVPGGETGRAGRAVWEGTSGATGTCLAARPGDALSAVAGTCVRVAAGREGALWVAGTGCGGETGSGQGAGSVQLRPTSRSSPGEGEGAREPLHRPPRPCPLPRPEPLAWQPLGRKTAQGGERSAARQGSPGVKDWQAGQERATQCVLPVGVPA